MSVHPRAGQPAESQDAIDVPRVVLSYYTEHVGAFGLGYAAIERFDDSRIRTMSGSYSIRIGASTLTATASRAIDGGHANAVSSDARLKDGC